MKYIVKKKKNNQSEFCYHLLKNIIHEKIFFTKNGKPYSQNYNIGISHTHNYILVAIDNKNFGIDLEYKKRINYKIIYKYFSKEETKLIKNYYDFLKLWVLKEAYIKYIDGTIDNYNDIMININNLSNNKNLKLTLISKKNYFIGICQKN